MEGYFNAVWQFLQQEICFQQPTKFVLKVVDEFNKKLNFFRLSFLSRAYKSIFLITNR